jgi:hypothetical protein
MPLKRIASAVGVSVATAHAWTRDIQITPEQAHRNLYGPRGPQNPEHIARRVASWRRLNRERRRGFQAAGRAATKRGDRLHLAGCMLYWADGAKDRNVVQFVNSDVAMLRFFRRFLTEALGVSPSDITIRLNVYTGNGLSIEQIERHWLDALDLPPSCIRAHSVNYLPTSSSGKKKNKLPYGVCDLRVNATHLVQHIYGAIQEYAGFEEPRWLDGPPQKSYKQKAATPATAPAAPSARGADSRPGPRPPSAPRRGRPR